MEQEIVAGVLGAGGVAAAAGAAWRFLRRAPAPDSPPPLGTRERIVHEHRIRDAAQADLDRAREAWKARR